jgi:predicted nucleotidyltransferase
MKGLNDLQLPQPLREALRTAHDQITTEFAVDRIVLFGSLVRGEADAESDVDLLIVLPRHPTWQMRDRITSLILNVNLEYGTNLSECIIDRQTWDEGLPSVLPIHQEIEAEGMRLWREAFTS